MKNYLQIVMDALALDGEGQNWNSFIDLDAHDRQYHHGHYDGGTCSLRDKLGTATQPGGLLDGMPSLDQFNNIVRQAINSGMIDENGREEINNILNDVANGLQNWEGGDEASVRQSVEEMKELYEGLRDAFAQQVREQDVETPNAGVEPVNEAETAETTQPQPPASSTNVTPTEEQIEHAIDRVMERYPGGSRQSLRDIFNRISNGDMSMARASEQTLRESLEENDPVRRYVQGVIDGTQTPHQAEVAQTTQTQTPQPTPAPAQAAAAEPVTRITDIIHRRPDVAINIAANKAPRSMNESLRRIAAQAVGRTSMQLRREGMGQATREILTALQNGTMNDAGRRYLLAMEQAAINGQMGSQSYPNVVVRAANRINRFWRDGGGSQSGQPAHVEQSEPVSTPSSYDGGQMNGPYNNVWQAICHANRMTVDSDKGNASKYSLDSAYTGDLYKLEGGAELRRGDGGCNCWKTAATNLIRTRGFNVRPKAEWQNETATQKSEFIKSQTACGKAYENISNLGNEGLRQKLTEIMTNDEKYPNGTAILCWDGHHGTLAIKHGRNLTHCDGWDSTGRPKDFNNAEDFINGYHPGYLGRGTPIQIGDRNPRKAAQLGKVCRDYVSANREKAREWRTLMAMDEASLSQAQRDMLNTPITLGDDLISLSPRDVYSTSVSYTNAYRVARGSNVSYVPSEIEIGRQMSGPDSAVGKIMGSYVVKPSDPIIPELFMLVQR